MASSNTPFDNETIKEYTLELNNLLEPAKKAQGMRIVYLMEDCIELLNKSTTETKINQPTNQPINQPKRVITINKQKNTFR